MSCRGDGSTGIKTGNWLFENFARTTRKVVPTTYNPTKLTELVAVVLEAERGGGAIKAIGTGWSYGGVAVDDSTTHVINTSQLTGLVSVGETVLPTALKTALPRAAQYYVEVRAGTKIHELNCALDGLGLAMPTLGASNGQSIAGAISTASHGSDVNMAPIADSVRAIHLVGPGGQEWWIERDHPNSITDPNQMQVMKRFGPLCTDIRIEYDTPLFRSVLVSLGRMGVIYSYVVEVVDAFLLTESRSPSTWREQLKYIRETIQVPEAQYNDKRYVEIVLNPYPQPDGERACVVTNRDVPTAGTMADPDGPPPLDLMGAFCDKPSLTPTLLALQVALPPLMAQAQAAAVAASAPLAAIPIAGPFLASAVITAAITPFVTLQTAIATLLALTPSGNLADHLRNACNLAITVGLKYVIPQIVGAVIPAIRGSSAGTRKSFRVLTSQVRCGETRPEEGDCLRNIDGIEIAVDVSPGSIMLPLFMNDVFALTDELYTQNTPVGYGMSLRFCTKTEAILGMQQFDRTCSVEFIMLRGLGGVDTFKTRLFDIAKRRGAIPHWGLLHSLTASDVNALYREVSTWRQSLQFLIQGGNGKASAFRTTFAIERGLDPETYQGPEVIVADEQTGEAYPYDFGACQLHERRTVLLHFLNEGQGTLRIWSVDADGNFRDSDIPPDPLLGTFGRPKNLELLPVKASALRGEEIQVRATFVAEEAGAHTGYLSINTNAVNLPTRIIRIPIRAFVEVVNIEVQQPAANSVLDLGSAGIGEWRFGVIVVRNSSTMAMALDSFTLSNPALADELNVERGAVAVGQVRTFTVTWVPTAVGTVLADITLHFTDGRSPSRVSQDVVVSVRGVGVGAQARLQPSLIDFGDAIVGAQTQPEGVTLENTGEQPLLVTSYDLPVGFQLVGTPPNVVVQGQPVLLSIVFRPAFEGPLVGTLTITSNSVRPPSPVALQGVGIAEVLMSASPDSMQFDPTPVGGRSGERLIVLRNRGIVPATIQSVQVVGSASSDFTAVRTACVGQTISTERSCELRVAMSPTSAGAKQASLQITFNGATSPLLVPLAGDAISATGLVPNVSELSFVPTAVGTQGRTLRATIRNLGTTVANITGVVISGANAADFSMASDDCSGAALGPGDRCAISVSVQPGAAGPRTAEIAINADVPSSGVTLRAKGVAARMEWSLGELDFGTSKVGTRSRPQNVQLFNTGDVPIMVTSIEPDPEFETIDMVPTVNNIARNQAKYFRVAFTPTTAGERIGTLTVRTAPPGGTYSLTTRGIGQP